MILCSCCFCLFTWYIGFPGFVDLLDCDYYYHYFLVKRCVGALSDYLYSWSGTKLFIYFQQTNKLAKTRLFICLNLQLMQSEVLHLAVVSILPLNDSFPSTFFKWWTGQQIPDDHGGHGHIWWVKWPNILGQFVYIQHPFGSVICTWWVVVSAYHQGVTDYDWR